MVLLWPSCCMIDRPLSSAPTRPETPSTSRRAGVRSKFPSESPLPTIVSHVQKLTPSASDPESSRARLCKNVTAVVIPRAVERERITTALWMQLNILRDRGTSFDENAVMSAAEALAGSDLSVSSSSSFCTPWWGRGHSLA